jgi:hypothetical protein
MGTKNSRLPGTPEQPGKGKGELVTGFQVPGFKVRNSRLKRACRLLSWQLVPGTWQLMLIYLFGR